MTRITAFAGLLCLCLVIVAGAADRVGNARLFPFPLVEAERMITRWFAASSFQTAVAETGGGDKQVRAQKAAEEWKIVLKPSSPLNTEVSARCSVAGVEDAVRLETFWAALDRYAKGSQQVKGESRPAAPARDWSAPTAVLRHQEATVCLENAAGTGHIQLSGFVCDDSGLILTTAHDMKEHSALTVITGDGRRFHGRTVKLDHLRDLALIQAGFRPGHTISPARGRLTLDLGETIYAIGCPQGSLGGVYVGTVNSPPRLANAMPLWQVGMTVFPGSSGSPVFDGRGNLVGVIKGRFRGTNWIGFLIPVSIVLEFLGR